MRHGEGPCEDRTGLAILLVAVAEEERVRSGIAVSERTRLPDEAAGERRTTLHARARGDDEVRTDDTVAKTDGRFLHAIDTPVVEAARADDAGIGADLHVRDIPHIRDMCVGTDRAVGGAQAIDIAPDEVT